MENLAEFKASKDSETYLYSYLLIPPIDYYRFTIFPDGADYIVFSSRGYPKIIEKQKKLLTLEVCNEPFFVLRLKPYTLKILQEKDFIFKSQLILLNNEIFTTRSIIKQKDMVDKFIFKDMEMKKSDIAIAKAINFIFNQKGEGSVEGVSRELDIGIRTLQRHFKHYISMTPKEYIDVIKLQSVITKTNKIKYNKSHYVPEYFVDYSHFYKVFKRYTGVSPNVFYSSSLNHLKSIYEIF